MAVSPNVTVEAAIERLNAILALDPQAVQGLLAARVPCNAALAADPGVQVGRLAEHHHVVGFLGLLNGLFGAYGDDHPGLIGWGPIVALMDDHGRIARFVRATECRVA